jgi:hypothetical protein
VSWPWIAVLAAALVVVIGAEWPRISSLVGADARRLRERKRRKASFRVVRSAPDDSDPGPERDDFEESVRRDLDALPTIEERDRT